jgi:hypothetical protein
VRERAFGVFCLEGQWLDDLSEKASLRGLLEMLNSWGVVDDFIHRDVGTVEEFCKFAGRWGEEYEDYELAYFASHGSSSHIWLDSDASVSLEQLGELLEDQCHGRVIHLGGCSTLDTRRSAIEDLRAASGARAVCGYTEDVDTIEAAALEMLLMTTLGSYDQVGHALNAFEKHPVSKALGGRLGFEIWG